MNPTLSKSGSLVGFRKYAHLQGVVGRDSRLGIVVEHLENEVLELDVIGDGVSGLTGASTARAPAVDAQYVAQSPLS